MLAASHAPPPVLYRPVTNHVTNGASDTASGEGGDQALSRGGGPPRTAARTDSGRFDFDSYRGGRGGRGRLSRRLGEDGWYRETIRQLARLSAHSVIDRVIWIRPDIDEAERPLLKRVAAAMYRCPECQTDIPAPAWEREE